MWEFLAIPQGSVNQQAHLNCPDVMLVTYFRDSIAEYVQNQRLLGQRLLGQRLL